VVFPGEVIATFLATKLIEAGSIAHIRPTIVSALFIGSRYRSLAGPARIVLHTPQQWTS